MATFNEIGVLVDGSVENVDTTGNIFAFETIRFGTADITITRAERLVESVTGQELDTTYHTHDSQYFTQAQIQDQGGTLAGTEIIGYDTTHAWQSITPSTGFLQELLESFDTQLANISTEFAEATFRITQTADPTTKLAFDLSNIAIGETRTIIMPDQDINLGNITTTDYVDNAVSLAISGLSAKPSCQLASRPQDWIASPSRDYIGLGTNATVDGLLDGQFFVVQQASSQGGGTYAIWFSEGITNTPPVTGTIATIRVDVNTTDTQEVAVAKMVAAMVPVMGVDYTILAWPEGSASNGEVELSNNFNGVTDPIAVSDDQIIAVNNINNYVQDESYTRGFDGVGYSQVGEIVTFTGLRTNFLNTGPILDGEFTLDVGYRILIKDMPQVDNRYNGIWEVVGVPSVSSIEVRRPVDSDGLSGFPEAPVFSEVREGNYTFITQGITNGSRGFIMITPGLLTVNSDSQEWTQFISVQQIVPNTEVFDFPFIQIDDFQRINLGPLTDGQMIIGSQRNDPIPLNTKSAESDILGEVTSSGIGGLTIKDNRIVDSMIQTGTLLEESQTFFGATNITGAEAEQLTDGSNADSLHIHNTDNLTEGSTNIFFTEPRTLGTVLTGFNPSLPGDIVATDTIIQAFGKVQNAITSNLEPNKANVELDNISNVALNADLDPATTNTIDLGNSSLKFKDGWFAGVLSIDSGTTSLFFMPMAQASDASIANGSIWSLNNGTNTLRYKDGAGTSDDIVMSVVAQTLQNKTMDFTTATGNNTIILSTSEVTEGTNLYYTEARVNANIASKTTDDLAEGSTNLYYTDARVQAVIAAGSTDDVSEGATNLYYTDERVDDRVAALIQDGTGISWVYDDGAGTLTPTVSLAPFNTDNLAEGSSNLYYTDTRVDNRIALQKAQPNGLATLDGSGLIPSNQLPSFVDDVLEFADLASFPGTGETGKIYVALDTNLTYRWSGTVYIEIASNDVSSVNGQTGVINLTTTEIPEGVNLYFTQARSIASVLTGFTSGAGTITAADTVLEAIQKLDGNLAGFTSGDFWSDEVDADIIPDGNGTRNLGSSARIFATLWGNDINIGLTGELRQTSMPSGTTATLLRAFNFGGAVGLATGNNSTNDASNTGSVLIESGNKTSGTGNSGNIEMLIGTTSGGTQGVFKMRKAGDTINPGDVWTAISADGEGYWAAPTGGGVSLLQKGSLLTSDGTTNGELTVDSTDGALLIADSTETAGLKYVTSLLLNDDGLTIDGYVRNNITTLGGGDFNFDWNVGNMFNRDISASASFAFVNSASGQTIIVKMNNTSGSPVDATFLGSVQWSGGVAVTSIPANSSNLYTFTNFDGVIYASVVDGLS